ncbi:hypothetical protein SAMN05421594_3750 [Chryseobacterium oleae]|uniref:Uncharacterized protein n=1 Tax=Chryseobacterium oleae TaxID=491207 RepID=A0A1I5AWY4_CHROL|nr:hypothetical protein [Chryseobacterium oleae]SFN66954.1 hypothetical protein SAMN05421594_3750 [Chryseobacterium oleae]
MSLEILNNPLSGSSLNSILKDDSARFPGSSFPVLASPPELKQLTAKQIANTYYSGKPVMEGNGFQIYSDEPVFGGNIEEVVVYKSRFSQMIEGIEVVLFASKNGAFLLQRYMEALPSSKQLILFLEINDRYNYNTVMRVVAGADLTKNKDLPFNDLLTFTRKHEVSVSPKALEDLIKNGIYRNKVGFVSWLLGLKDASVEQIFSFFKQEILEGAAHFFIEGIADNIAKLRISENGWNPDAKEGEYNHALIPDVLYEELKKFYEHTAPGNPYENLEGQKKINSRIIKSLFERINGVKADFNNLLSNGENFFPAFIFKKIKQSLDLFFKQIDKIEEFLIDPLTGMQHIIYRSHQITNAFLCGIYNSLIDIIAGIFSIIGFIFKAVAAMDKVNDRKVEYGEMFLELMEDFTEGIMKFDYVDFFKQCITFQIRTIIRLVMWVDEKVPQFTLEKAAYYYGYIIGIIIDIIVETLLTGGAAAVAKLAKTVESFILNPLEKISKAITQAGNFLTRMMEFISMLLREFKKGTKEIFSKLGKVLDEIFGFGDEVADHALTPSERRVKEKQKKIQKKIEQRKTLYKKVDKKYKEFIDKWENVSLIKLSKLEIIDGLKGFTKHGDEVAELIKNNKMQYEFLDDVDFEDLLRDYDYTGELTDEIIMSTRAATLDNKTFYRASTSIEEFLTEVIHEGSHVVDNLLKEQLLSEGKTLKEIEKIIGNNWDQEIRAYSHEQAWHTKVGRDPEYKSLNDIKKHVKTVYTKY